MNKSTFLLVAVLMMLMQAGFAADATQPLNCNQLGREIALRAAESLQATLDAPARAELAALAEATCVEYTRTAALPLADEAGQAETQESGELFDIELIDPEDRVRRPGLKRR